MKKYQTKEITLPPTSSSELIGMQSVRATFKLSKRTIKTINIVATQLGIRQKSLFDHLMADAEGLSSIADEMQQMEPVKKGQVQKTYVISRRSLSCLENISKTRNAPRDILIEYSVQRLLPIIEREQEKQKKRKEIVNEFKQYVKQGQRLLNKASELLDEEDVVYNRLAVSINVSVNAFEHMAEFLKKGEVLDEYTFTKP